MSYFIFDNVTLKNIFIKLNENIKVINLFFSSYQKYDNRTKT